MWSHYKGALGGKWPRGEGTLATQRDSESHGRSGVGRQSTGAYSARWLQSPEVAMVVAPEVQAHLHAHTHTYTHSIGTELCKPQGSGKEGQRQTSDSVGEAWETLPCLCKSIVPSQGGILGRNWEDV